MTNEHREAQASREGMVTRYKVDVGEEFPLSEEESGQRCRFEHEWHAHGRRDREWRHEWRHDEWRGEWRGFRAPRLLVLFAVVALGVALISTAASYPLATLAVAAAVLLFAGGHFHHRGGRHHRHRHGRDAA